MHHDIIRRPLSLIQLVQPAKYRMVTFLPAGYHGFYLEKPILFYNFFLAVPDFIPASDQHDLIHHAFFKSM